MSLSRKGFLKMLGFGALAAGSKAYGLPSKALEGARADAKKLKITDVEIFLFDIPLTSPFRIAIGEMTAANDLLVRVRTDQGVTGLGEACPFPPITGETQATNAAAAKAIRDMIVGKDPLAIDDLLRLIGPLVHSNPSAVAAFDMAFFDILGQVAGLPLFRLLGGTKSVFETDITTSIDTLEKMTAEAKGYADKGYKTLKVKVGLDPDEDFARIAAIRSAVGPQVALRIDANQGWTVPNAIYGLRKMAPLKIQFCEQPVLASDVAGLKQVRAESPIAIMADEALFGPADAVKLVRAEACDTFNIKLMKAGGILNAVRIAHVADAANMRCMVGCMLETNLGLTAAAHVVASQANIVYADLDGNSEHVTNPIVGGMTVKAGTLTLPETPGLGCDVDPAFVKKLKRI
jgi:L-alanine-DL-glutamate epimerase-like enolase superfamily enzyme